MGPVVRNCTQDRKGNDFCLGPTHEEVVVDLVRRDVRSWYAPSISTKSDQISR